MRADNRDLFPAELPCQAGLQQPSSSLNAGAAEVLFHLPDHALHALFSLPPHTCLPLGLSSPPNATRQVKNVASNRGRGGAPWSTSALTTRLLSHVPFHAQPWTSLFQSLPNRLEKHQGCICTPSTVQSHFRKAGQDLPLHLSRAQP